MLLQICVGSEGLEQLHIWAMTSHYSVFVVYANNKGPDYGIYPK